MPMLLDLIVSAGVLATNIILLEPIILAQTRLTRHFFQSRHSFSIQSTRNSRVSVRSPAQPNRREYNTGPSPLDFGDSSLWQHQNATADSTCPCSIATAIFPLNKAAKLRKGRQQAELGRAFGRNVFDPAAAVISVDGHSNKRKKSSSDKHWKDGPSTKYTKPATQPAKLQKEKQLEYALVLVKNAESVPLRAHPSHPSHAVINSYEIENTAKAAFGGLRAVLDGIFSMDGWRLLTRVSRGKGHFPYLRPNKKEDDMMGKDLEWTNDIHRHARQFKKVVFIAGSE
ncbi:hypothetical protein PILCRDRAFT_10738 [Piloderma croceum F 1598]|uniref:Uncharacterized protein n=1 Tax=Piloderma croceum (strain F 1598) TaxID=765440 RepID=A0A0C3F2Q4_PILCF|nr:hypothetical protein PILCRDRAFT_10738 [Piloderma croceum F 1598]